MSRTVFALVATSIAASCLFVDCDDGVVGTPDQFLSPKIFDGKCELEDSEFLPSGSFQQTVALASYPRSGNSFLRGLLERATGYVTCARGSDHKLIALGFQGHRMDPRKSTDRHRCLVHKTHVPMNQQQLATYWRVDEPGAYSGAFDKVLMLVRNPFDVAFSSFHYFGSNNHTGLKLNSDGSVMSMTVGSAGAHARMWGRHIQYWLNRTVDDGTPSQGIHTTNLPKRWIVRYEDLKANPQYFVTRIANWLGVTLDDERLQCALGYENNMVRCVVRCAVPHCGGVVLTDTVPVAGLPLCQLHTFSQSYPHPSTLYCQGKRSFVICFCVVAVVGSNWLCCVVRGVHSSPILQLISYSVRSGTPTIC